MDLAAYFADAYLPRLIARGVQPGTIADYEAVVRSAPPYPTAAAVTAWLGGLRQPPATRNRTRRYLLAVLRDARRHGLVGRWIDSVPVALENQTLPRAWTLAEFEQLLGAAEQVRETYCGLAGAKWWHSLLLSAWYTGARVGSLLSARMGDLNITAGTLVVTSSKDRRQILYRLPSDCCDSLRQLRGTRPLVWPWPWADRTKTLLRRMRRIIRLAGLPQLRNPFHAIRRSVATYVAAEAGISTACDLLDHCRPAITRRYYIDPRITVQSRDLSRLMPRPQN